MLVPKACLILMPKKLWNNVHKTSNSKANVHVVSVGGVSGSSNVADMWKDHFEKLYNSRLLIDRPRTKRLLCIIFSSQA